MMKLGQSKSEIENNNHRFFTWQRTCIAAAIAPYAFFAAYFFLSISLKTPGGEIGFRFKLFTLLIYALFFNVGVAILELSRFIFLRKVFTGKLRYFLLASTLPAFYYLLAQK